ncbi:MAG TPA: competence/damage-inducible protein A [Candidatus Alistipes stercorigallinarum]|uniref:competence/damage-inducible protein A n=1 Tax=uncultured Alistipes sp. TaxID=538949 RepID=UPI001FA07E2E|nr:competence/damage-inducible protein A [uncultured Alistipes sp.]HJC17098.1 competence/damage-inducible protein A [Candidatus Alistipes stercorigallinarum]
MQATILTIGDEILIGQIVDTNSVSIAKYLNAAGVVVREKCSIGDDRDQIVTTLERCLAHSDIVILTGGLGPTKDDITKKTLAEMFHSELVVDPAVEAHVRRMLEARGIDFNELNRGQALVPACCTVLFNAHGTAPGMWFERDGKVVVSLPGVPFEMEHLMQDEVMPRLKAHFSLRQIVHRTLITAGLAESMLAKRIEKWEEALPPYLKLAYLPNPGAVRLRLSAYEVEGEPVAREIERQFEALRKIIPEYVVGYEKATMQELVHRMLTERGLTLATAESCTGGAIASRFTAMPGASAYFLCGVVSYSNESKSRVLGVPAEDIARYGAVSEQVARHMAEGARRLAGADYAVATTGIAGPTGGSAQKPVGTVWMAVATPRGTRAEVRQCGTDRGQIIDRASAFAIGMLHEELGKELPQAPDDEKQAENPSNATR